MKRRAIFLDRDGIINEAVIRAGKPFPPASLAELKIVEGAESALLKLKQAGFCLLVVTNQPDVRRGTTTQEAVERMHAFLGQQLPLDDFLVCYHDDADNCLCRKPLPGLILDGASRHEIDPTRSYLVGDRWRDIDAGAAAGCMTVLVDRGYNERSPTSLPNHRVSSLTEAADWILEQEKTV